MKEIERRERGKERGREGGRERRKERREADKGRSVSDNEIQTQAAAHVHCNRV